ncbi:hypothetical protein BV25DRAFT_1986593 [Artomyces pyxidatus]|uniref:Uncharacterized protein n=1 Tax=Artomyces pyxidatus TaxID=48021 RepID=A0ACB8TKZ2_9AGAM|nr:hypothetical protein BV25DRAFT_1986593 [Artomyces pyxidatus]
MLSYKKDHHTPKPSSRLPSPPPAPPILAAPPIPSSQTRKSSQPISKAVKAVARVIKKLKPRRRGKKTSLEIISPDEGDLESLPTYESIVFATVPSDCSLYGIYSSLPHDPSPQLTAVPSTTTLDIIASLPETHCEVADTAPAPTAAVLPVATSTKELLLIPDGALAEVIHVVATSIDVSPTDVFERRIAELHRELDEWILKSAPSYVEFSALEQDVHDVTICAYSSDTQIAVSADTEDLDSVPTTLNILSAMDVTKAVVSIRSIAVVAAEQMVYALTSAGTDLPTYQSVSVATDLPHCATCKCHCSTPPAKVYASVEIQTDIPIAFASSPSLSIPLAPVAPEEGPTPPVPPAPGPAPMYKAPAPVHEVVRARKGKGGKVMAKIKAESNMGGVVGELRAHFRQGNDTSSLLRKTEVSVKAYGAEKERFDPRALLKKTSVVVGSTVEEAKESELSRALNRRRGVGASTGESVCTKKYQTQDVLSELHLALANMQSRDQRSIPDYDATTDGNDGDDASSVSGSDGSGSTFSSRRTSSIYTDATSPSLGSPVVDSESPWGSRVRSRTPRNESLAPKRMSAVQMELMALSSGRRISEDGPSLRAIAIMERRKREKEEAEARAKAALDEAE